MWNRFIAIGDSLTEGVGDPLPGGTLRGWADRLADGLRRINPDLEYLKLAYRGLRTAEVRDQQLQRALGFRPDLATATLGMNDLRHPDFDRDVFRADLVSVVEPLVGGGATVLMSAFPDLSRHALLPRRAREVFRSRLMIKNEVARDVSREYGTVFVDMWELPEAQGRDVLSLDRLHPGERGHQLIAAAFAEALEGMCGRRIPLDPVATRRLMSRSSLRHARWLATNARRSKS